MQTHLSRIGASLALLAISLQVVLCAWGGRICFQSAPLPESSDCASGCCDAGDDVKTPDPVIVLVVADFLIAPAGSDCCFEHALENLGQTTQQTKPLITVDGAEVVAAIASMSLPAAPALVVWSPARRLGLAPPAIPIVRSTILLL